MSSSSPFGKVFINISWVLLLVGLALLFQEVLDNKANPNQDPTSLRTSNYTEVTLVRNQQHHYVANGTINGAEVTFLVDTGATLVAIGPALAEELGLKRGYQGIAHTANGTTTTYATTINRLTLGDITLRDVRASITMGMNNEEILLGMSALKQLELTQRNGELRMRQYH